VDGPPPYDVTFDFRADTPEGKDSDSHSALLRRYHQRLWSKELPTGGRFELEEERTGYLLHRSERGEFWMTSDWGVPTYRGWVRRGLPEIVAQVPVEELDDFDALTSTIGGRMLFPSWTGVRGETINQAKGWRYVIADRLDLTLECIRRRYEHDESPLTSVLARYDAFFDLFGGFEGYVGFFLLDDLLTPDRSGVQFFLPFDEFSGRHATPRDLDEYQAFRDVTTAFVEARNERIAAIGFDGAVSASGAG
jgi:hypothetical protein